MVVLGGGAVSYERGTPVQLDDKLPLVDYALPATDGVLHLMPPAVNLLPIMDWI